MTAYSKQNLVGIVGLGLMLSMPACTPIKQARNVEESGFLGDYSALREGQNGEALKIYLNPNYPQICNNYDKVLIEPVGIWVGKNSDMATISPDDRQMLVNHLHGSLVNELGKHYQIVRTPQPGTLRIRAAITEAEGSWVALDTVSSFVPQLLVMSKLKEIATGTGSFVGKASGEVEITDASTGERLAVAVDRMVGNKSVTGVTGKWDDVTRTFDDWSDRMAYRLANCGANRPEQ
ncbi:DUF3313 domain-containing protein [Methylomonas sp. SURF-2]|uniref:DUF3313 domain-containing protein n=1 Tax=Methylomonas subterranea TaxID=2952225 RepID=A0ABT1TAU8_9GAMM|nr:DUF3313 domain-containing protein [Methylomonas sp. SURF-2]MCQ8102598.1 DUF3313 domain-containing protein [Methylomonas sp. SURF-2]